MDDEALCMVLVVDDDRAILRTVSRAFRRPGCRVVTAGNGIDVLSSLRRHGLPDAVVLDLKLPGVDGAEVLRGIRQVSATVPVIIFSASLDDESEATLIANGATACLLKTETERLVHEIDEAVSPILRPATRLLVAQADAPATNRLARLVAEVVPSLDVELARTRDAALASLKACRPDLVLLDWRLEGGGASILEAAAAQVPSVPVIVTDTGDSAAAFHSVFSGGAASVLADALHAEALGAAVVRALRAARAPAPVGLCTEDCALLETEWQDGAAFRAGLVEGVDTLTFFVPLSAARGVLTRLEVGGLVLVHLQLRGHDSSFWAPADVIGVLNGTEAGVQVRVRGADRQRLGSALAYAEKPACPSPRRAHARIPCSIPARLLLGSAAGLDVVATDVSAGGLRFSFMEPRVDPGMPVVFTFGVPDQPESCTVSGRIAYVETRRWPQAAGVQFVCRTRREEEAARTVTELAQARWAQYLPSSHGLGTPL